MLGESYAYMGTCFRLSQDMAPPGRGTSAVRTFGSYVIEEAFNNTSREVIRAALHEIPLPIVKWLDHMMDDLLTNFTKT